MFSKRKQLLLHICCGPCVSGIVDFLRKQNFDVTGFYYNPNIYPYGEYKKRLDTVTEFASKINLEIVHLGFSKNSYTKQVAAFYDITKDHTQKPGRCLLCYKMRLEETARKAKELHIKNFSTTLLISPYQNIDAIQQMGNSISKNHGLNFFPDHHSKKKFKGFRRFFTFCKRIAKRHNMYSQKYCGCLYPKKEAVAERKKVR
ncbi:MAG: hypothetical protein ACD_63C00221G0002 [uncultured bacterium]|nr:MAG: hypothetical protein ACD_63C00221G0002 [uncultured bacterium]